tara:strand:- start:965 stop:1645 length:681 start_codon:yes stop_codon:yes gene_type:complete
MNYLSFDVGIINLAYCELTSEKEIKQWGILNMNDNPICNMNLKKPCEKRASYVLNNNGIKNYYCSCHIKHKSIDKKCKKKKINSNYDLFKLSQNCINELGKINLENISYVLIENQPALKNPTMKSIQMIIYTFFIMNGVMNEKSNIKEVHMINARNKLKVYKGPKVECPYEENKKNRYKINKYLAIKYCENMIDNDCEEFKLKFNGSKKKDDLADCYLQGIYYIEK